MGGVETLTMAEVGCRAYFYMVSLFISKGKNMNEGISKTKEVYFFGHITRACLLYSYPFHALIKVALMTVKVCIIPSSTV